MIRTLLAIFYLTSTVSIYAQQYGVENAPNTPTSASPGVVFSWPQYANQNFLYDGQYLNQYGIGFHDYNDGTSIGGINAYISSYFGVDFFAGGQRRLRINTTGQVRIDQNLWVNNSATISSDFNDSDPNGSWNYNLTVRNNNPALNTFSRLTFVSESGGFGAISVKRTSTYAGDMYLQVRNGSGFYVTPMLIKSNGDVGIGTTTPDAKLAVKGTIHTQEVRVDMTGAMVPDYVFENDYNLPTLTELEAYIKVNKHLPEVPSACVVEENGFNLGEMNMLLLKKVEELTLYVIDLKKQNETQQAEIDLIKAKQK